MNLQIQAEPDIPTSPDMSDPSHQHPLTEEIRGLREDLRRHVRNALLVFAGAVVLVCLVFGQPISKDARQFLALGGVLVALGMFLYLVGLVFQAIFNARLRKRHERENFAILSGRTAAARRPR